MATKLKSASSSIKERRNMVTSKNAVIVKEGASPPAVMVPDFMKSHAGKGVEKLGQGDVAVPRVKLLQATSPEVMNNRDLRAGEFYHTIAEKSMGESIRMVPIFIDLSAILWRPRVEGGGILARCPDNKHWFPPNAVFEVNLKRKKEDPDLKVKWATRPTEEEAKLLKWGSSNPSDPNSQPAGTRMYNIVSFFPDFPELSPAVVTLQRGAIRAAQQFTGKIKIAGAPSYGMYFDMVSIQERGSDGSTFFNYKFTADGFVTDEAEFNKYFEWYGIFEKMGVTIRDEEGLQDDGESNATSAKSAEPSDSQAKY